MSENSGKSSRDSNVIVRKLPDGVLYYTAASRFQQELRKALEEMAHEEELPPEETA